MIQQGDIYWVDFGLPTDSEAGFARPVVVVQSNLVNASRINTLIVCPLTANVRRSSAPGNVLVLASDTGLTADSVVNGSLINHINKDQLGDYVGTLEGAPLDDILDGIQSLLEPRDLPR